MENLPSILSGDFAGLGEQVAQLEAAGCRRTLWSDSSRAAKRNEDCLSH
jgi:hypothetical protein